jgi:GH35 family endo-1,4-beta-xylanase
LINYGYERSRYGWIPYAAPEAGHAADRPLPLNSEYRRELFMDVIDQFTGKER